jgi:hypothetical protein
MYISAVSNARYVSTESFARRFVNDVCTSAFLYS